MYEIFTEELGTIENDDIREFCINILKTEAPDYFYTVAASSTGKYHPQYALGEGGLVRHTKAAMRFLNHMLSVEHIKSRFSARQQDLLRVAMICHDMRKHGDNGSAYTVFDHPIIAAEAVRKHKDESLSNEEVEFIASAIETHMGEWNTDRRSCTVLPKPITAAQQIVHLSDYLASRKQIELTFDNDKTVSKPTVDTYVVPFGKHRGMTLVQIKAEDSDYFDWMKNNIEKEPVKSLLREI